MAIEPTPDARVIGAYLDDVAEELEAVRRLASPPSSRLASFHLQQAAEKLTKAARLHAGLQATVEHNRFVARRNAQVGTGGARVTQIERQCLTLTHFSTAADGRYQPITERLCLAETDRSSEHDYLTDGPYQVP